jgi:hypothetical protein
MSKSNIAVAAGAPASVSVRKPAAYAETALVTVLVANPKRAASAKRFALYGAVGGSPVTVKSYLDGCAALHPDEPRYRWRADLAWDLARKFISIA